MIKIKKRKILLLPGDGIGPEVMAEVEKIIKWFNSKKSLDFEIDKDLVGGAAYDKHGSPITDEAFYKAQESAAVILGAVGGPKWDNLDFSKKPERALLKLRKELKLFANLRPAICFKQLVDASSLKPELVSDLDLLFVRELTGGINTHVYTSSEIQRVARVAFDLARKRNNKVTSCEKSNVMEAGQLWKEEVQSIHEKEYSDVELNHMLADNCAMQLVRNPKQFDVIVTDNLFGDMLSDEAAMLTGSLGLLPSASLGAKDKNGNMRSLYEPVHGSAPDIAGQGIANPIATILSFAMALRYSLDLDKEADSLEKAVQDVLDEGLRTKDIISKGMKLIGLSFFDRFLGSAFGALRALVVLVFIFLISKEELANKEWWEESYFSYHIIEISKLIENVRTVKINFGSILEENMNARKYFMVIKQMLKYIDENQSIRFLIAECDFSLTVMTALYYSKLFGVEEKVDISALLALGNVSHGEKVFKKCSACHLVNKGGENKIGPALYGVIGRKVASKQDYKYSKAMAAYDKDWTFEEMNGYLKKPQSYIKGTKMAFAGLRKEKDRASVILYLNQNSDNPLPLP